MKTERITLPVTVEITYEDRGESCRSVAVEHAKELAGNTSRRQGGCGPTGMYSAAVKSVGEPADDSTLRGVFDLLHETLRHWSTVDPVSVRERIRTSCDLLSAEIITWKGATSGKSYGMLRDLDLIRRIGDLPLSDRERKAKGALALAKGWIRDNHIDHEAVDEALAALMEKGGSDES